MFVSLEIFVIVLLSTNFANRFLIQIFMKCKSFLVKNVEFYVRMTLGLFFFVKDWG